MPSYDYVCTVCGHEFELVQKMTDPPRKRCPKCGKKVERKIGSGAGIIFKGSGFYATDYRSADYQAKARAEKAGTTAKPDAGEKAGSGEKSGKGAGGEKGSSDGGGTKPASEKSPSKQ
jgi:putative FmdB family regulatory protein